VTTFKPPIKSKDLLEGIPFDQADDTEPAAKKRFDDFDKTGTKDPNKCKALLNFQMVLFSGVQNGRGCRRTCGGTGAEEGKQLSQQRTE
jgi:hypothetical protein